jgi:hypothetical protein
MQPWQPNMEVVECVMPGHTYDLYNNCTLVRLRGSAFDHACGIP